MNVKKHDIVFCIVIAILAGIIGAGIIGAGEYTKRIIDAQNTIDKLSTENKQLKQTIADFAGERQRIYKDFADTIKGAGGDISNALATVQRLEGLANKVSN
jgi:hypothetical protein